MNNIIQVIETLCDKVGIAIDWTSENVVPQIYDVIHRYATAKCIEHLIGVGVPFIFLILGIVGIVSAIKHYKKAHDGVLTGLDDYEPEFWLIVVSCLAIFGALVCMIINGIELSQWASVPEVKIIEMLNK